MGGKPDLNYLIGLMPRSPKGQQRVPASGSWSYGIPVGVKPPDASWELVEWLCHEPTASCWFMQQQGRPSPLGGRETLPPVGQGDTHGPQSPQGVSVRGRL